MNTKVLCFYGGPGTGKSTCSTGAFASLKESGINAEYVPEYAKELAWAKRHPVILDQFTIFGEQSRRESTLYGAVDVILTDSPLWLQAYYAKEFGRPDEAAVFSKMSKLFHEMGGRAGVTYHHIWLNRCRPYNPAGRFQTEEGAKAIDLSMRQFLLDQGLHMTGIDGTKEAATRHCQYLLNRNSHDYI